MKEGKPNPFETGQEHIPTAEEVHSVFRELIGKDYAPTRVLEDEKGIYLLEVMVPTEMEGEAIEYNYTRKGRHSQNIQSSSTEIHAVYYANGVPTGGIRSIEHGTLAARFVNGKWEIF